MRQLCVVLAVDLKRTAVVGAAALTEETSRNGSKSLSL